MTGEEFIYLITIVLTVPSILLLYLDRKDEEYRYSTVITLSSLIIALVLIIYLPFSRMINSYAFSDNGGALFSIDIVGVLLSIAAIISTIITVTGSLNEVPRWSTRSSFYSLILLTLLGIIYISFLNNIIVLLTSWALSAAASYALVAIKKDLLSTEVSTKYLIMGIISSSIMIYGLLFYVSYSGSLYLGQVLQLNASPLIAVASVVFIITAFGFKIGSFPFQGWLPDVYIAGDRIIVSFISGTVKLIGIATLTRLLYNLSFVVRNVQADTISFLVLALVSSLSMVFGNFTAFSRRNFASIIAYSGITQAGFFFIGFSSFFLAQITNNISLITEAINGIVLQSIAYTVAQAGLFISMHYIEKHTGSLELDMLRGLWFKSPVLVFSISVLLLSLLGVPPLLGFWGKLYLFASVASPIGLWLLILGVINSAISSGYYLIIMREMFREEKQGYKLQNTIEVYSSFISALIIIILGIFTPVIITYVG